MRTPAGAGAEPVGTRAVIAFRLGEESYALALEAVEEVAPGGAVRRRPDLPGALCGAVRVRGGEVPVLDLRRRLGLPDAAEGAGKVLVCRRAGEERLGLLVDEVSGVREVPAGTLVAPPRYFERAAAHLLGIARLEDGLVLLLDPVRLLAAPAEENPGRAEG